MSIGGNAMGSWVFTLMQQRVGATGGAPTQGQAAAAGAMGTGLLGGGLAPPRDLAELRAESATVAAFMWRQAAEWGLKALGVVLVLMGAWMLGGWLRRIVYRALNRPQFDQTLVRFLSNLLRWAVLIIGIIASLTIFGVAPASLAAIVGATGLAIGLALQGSLSNLAAGIMLMLLRPFRVGDVVTVAGQTGKVDDIELFHTKLDTADNRRLHIPNSQVFGGVIDNATHHLRRRADVVLLTPMAADFEQTRRVLLEAAMSVPGRLDDPPPSVSVAKILPAGVEWLVTIWGDRTEVGRLQQEAYMRCRGALDRAGLTFATPPPPKPQG